MSAALLPPPLPGMVWPKNTRLPAGMSALVTVTARSLVSSTGTMGVAALLSAVGAGLSRPVGSTNTLCTTIVCMLPPRITTSYSDSLGSG